MRSEMTKPKIDPWNPPELAGKSKGEIHDYFEHLGCEAAKRGEAQLKDAHEAWIHGWTMAMEGAGKLEDLKVGHRKPEKVKSGHFFG
jgi:hypothetical protein